MLDSKGPLIEEVEEKSTDESSDFAGEGTAKMTEEERERMAEEYKSKGNDYFKSRRSFSSLRSQVQRRTRDVL